MLEPTLQHDTTEMSSTGTGAESPGSEANAITKGRTKRPAHGKHQLTRSVLNLLQRDRNGRRVARRFAIRHPEASLWIAHHFVCGTISLGFRLGANDVLGRGNRVRAVHVIDRDRHYRLGGFVVKNLDRLSVVEDIEVLVVTFITGTAQLLPHLVRSHAEAHTLKVAEQRLFDSGLLRVRDRSRNRRQGHRRKKAER